MKKVSKKTEVSNNRKKAKELQMKKTAKSVKPLSEREVQKLIHDLDVHQIELEMQNAELKTAMEKEEATAKKYIELYDFAPSGNFTLSKDGDIIDLNMFGASLLGKSRKRLINNRFALYISDDTKPIFNLFFIGLYKRNVKESCEVSLSVNDKPPIFVLLTGLVTEEGKECLVNLIDITERKKTEEKIISANRLYDFISQINQMLVHTSDKETLFKQVCRIATDVGKFRMAWIGLIDKKSKKVIPVTHAGEDDGYLKKIKPVSIADTPSGRGPTGTALRKGKYIVCNDIAKNPLMAPWKSLALKRGYHSSIALPIKVSGKIIGAFSLYASVVNYFNDTEIKLLDEVTRDVCYALENFEIETKRIEAEAEIRKNEKLFQAMVENSDSIIVLTDKNFKAFYRSPSTKKITGWTNEESDKIGSNELTHPDDREKVKKFMESALKNPGKLFPFSIRGKHKNGGYVELEGTAINLLNDENIRAIVTNLHDVTEKKITAEKIRENESRLVKAQAIAHIGSWEINFETNIAVWSAEACRIYGLEPDDNIQTYETFLSFIHPEDLDFVTKKVNESMANALDTSFQHRIICMDGTVRHIYSERKFEFDSTGKPIGLYGIAHDITERKIAEKVMQESEAKYRSVVENIHESLIIEDNDGKLIYANNEFTKIFGFTPDECNNLSLKDYTAPESYDEIVERHNLRLQGIPVAEEFIYKGKRKDGTELWIEARVSSIIENGKIIGTQSLERDITERKLAEEKLKKSDERYRSLIEQASDAIMISDFNGNFIDVNESLCKMFDYSKAELQRMNIADLIDAEQLKERPVNFNKLKEGIHVITERRMIHRNGTIIEVEANVKKVNDDMVLAIARDITERKKAERKIIESENKLQTIIQTKPECIKLLNSKGELLSMNPAGLAMIEADSEAQVAGQRMDSIINSDYKIAFNKITQNVFKGISGKLEFEITGLKGTHRWLETHAVPMNDSDGNITSLLGVTRDITEKKKAEKEILQMNEQLRELSAHLQSIREEERINMAHDIHDVLGQQLTIVKMNLYSLLKKYKNISPEFNEQAELIGESINKTVNTVRKIASDLRPVILDEQGLDDALTLHSSEFSKHMGIPCHITIEGTEMIDDININTQVFRIYQEALTNIARHANASSVDSTMKTENGLLKLLITDNGIGFNPNTDKEKKSLGLVMMRERATSIGATLQIISEPYQGTSVLLSLPINSKY